MLNQVQNKVSTGLVMRFLPVMILVWLAGVLVGCAGHNYAPVEDLEKPRKVTSG